MPWFCLKTFGDNGLPHSCDCLSFQITLLYVTKTLSFGAKPWLHRTHLIPLIRHRCSSTWKPFCVHWVFSCSDVFAQIYFVLFANSEGNPILWDLKWDSLMKLKFRKKLFRGVIYWNKQYLNHLTTTEDFLRREGTLLTRTMTEHSLEELALEWCWMLKWQGFECSGMV